MSSVSISRARAGPRRSSSDAIITTSAPASTALTTSSPLRAPDERASEKSGNIGRSKPIQRSGKRISAYPACAPEVRLAGGEYAEIPIDGAVTDAPFVTAPAWPAHPEWLRQFLVLLGTRIEP